MERSPRYLLLPGWLRFFAWCYFAGGIVGLMITVYLVGTEASFHVRFNFFGQSYPGELRSWMSVAACGLAVVTVGATHALLWGRRRGRLIGLAFCYACLVLSVISFYVGMRRGVVTLSPFQPILLVAAIFALHRVRKAWNATPEAPLLGEQSRPVAG